MKVLALVDQRNGTIKTSSHEVLTTAANLAGSPESVAAIVIGSGVSAGLSSLAGFGAAKCFVADHESYTNYNALSYTDAISEAIKTFEPDLVLTAASPIGKDLLPRLAARHDAGILTDLTEISWQDGSVAGKKPMYAGKCIANIRTKPGKLHFASIRPNVFAAEQKGGDATPEILPNGAAPSNLTTKEIVKGKSSRPDLTEAVNIISGGRAMANADNFKILHECADTIGATVGASRAAVDSGYATHDMQVGQTGKTVNPNLYVACGISGSIQHMAGMRTSKVIVAVNTDPEAPIFGIADYGIVGDLFEVVPVLTKKLGAMIQH
jgi:electron transfer flavoprotein alpha subunit